MPHAKSQSQRQLTRPKHTGERDHCNLRLLLYFAMLGCRSRGEIIGGDTKTAPFLPLSRSLIFPFSSVSLCACLKYLNDVNNAKSREKGLKESENSLRSWEKK